MTFRKILCAVDFSDGSRQAMRVAVRLAIAANAELVLAHAWHVPALMYVGDAPAIAPNIVQQIGDEARRALDAEQREATDLGASRVTTKLLHGIPWDRIVELLDEDRAFDLVVVGTHGRTGIRRVLLGSVAEKVVRHAPCSVLAVRPDAVPAAFDHVLCPIDFSSYAQHAVAAAAKLVEPGGAGITLLHVLEVPVAYGGELPLPDLGDALDKEATRLLDDWAKQLRESVSVTVATRTRIGYPGAQTLAVLDDDPSITLVVVGSHGRTGIRRALLGSIAEKVVRHARCPVLVARTRST